MTITISGKTYEFPAPNNPDEEQISQKQPEPEKKKPPKGSSIRNDALINALLEQKSGGRGGKK